MYFDWDDEKAAANVKNHQGVTFEEAETVFGDPLARIFDDDEHSYEEKRNIIFGHSDKDRLLMVAYNRTRE